jgi:ribosomal protein S8
MGQRLIISEEERKEILSKYIMENVIEEQKKGSIAVNLYNRIKNKPIVKRLESLADPDFKKFVANVVREFPKYKKKESEMVSQGMTMMKNPEAYLEKNQSKVDQFAGSQIAEQAGGLAIVGVVGVTLLMLIIYTAKYGKKIEPTTQSNNPIIKTPTSTPKPPAPPKSDIDKKLEVLDGKTVNLYNDPNEQVLFGTERVTDFRFFDNSKQGERSGVRFGLGLRALDIDPYSELVQKLAKVHGVYEIICLANPERLADFIVKEGEYTKDYKYNKKFTDTVAQIAGPYCKRPEADFSVVSKQSSQNLA